MKAWFPLRLVAAIVVSATLAIGPVAAAGPARATGAAAGRVTPATCVVGHKACPIKIVFATGAYSAQASSKLTGATPAKYFSVKAKKGQQLTAWVIGAGPTRGVVTFANGTADGGPGGKIFEGQIPSTGTILIRASEDTMANAWSGKVTVLVVII